jgi:hypothetical protein
VGSWAFVAGDRSEIVREAAVGLPSPLLVEPCQAAERSDPEGALSERRQHPDDIVRQIAAFVVQADQIATGSENAGEGQAAMAPAHEAQIAQATRNSRLVLLNIERRTNVAALLAANFVLQPDAEASSFWQFLLLSVELTRFPRQNSSERASGHTRQFEPPSFKEKLGRDYGQKFPRV